MRSRPQSPRVHVPSPPATAPGQIGRPPQSSNISNIDRRAAWAAFMPESAIGLIDCDQAIASTFEVLRNGSAELSAQLRSGELELGQLGTEIAIRNERVGLLEESLMRLE